MHAPPAQLTAPVLEVTFSRPAWSSASECFPTPSLQRTSTQAPCKQARNSPFKAQGRWRWRTPRRHVGSTLRRAGIPMRAQKPSLDGRESRVRSAPGRRGTGPPGHLPGCGRAVHHSLKRAGRGARLGRNWQPPPLPPPPRRRCRSLRCMRHLPPPGQLHAGRDPWRRGHTCARRPSPSLLRWPCCWPVAPGWRRRRARRCRRAARCPATPTAC